MKIRSVARAIPEQSVGNPELERDLDLPPGWIAQRTGVLHRPTAAPDEATSDLAVRAATRALEAADIAPGQVGLVLLATSTPDHLLPPTAPLVAHRIGAVGAGAVDITGACAGFLYALTFADAFCRVPRGCGAVLVIGANVLSRRVNPKNIATAALFSDGAGAVVLTPDPDSDGLLGVYLGSDGSRYDVIGIPAGGSRQPLTAEAVTLGKHLMEMQKGSHLFREAVQRMSHAGEQALQSAGLTPDAVDWWVPHQANQRIIDDAGQKLGIPPDKTISVIDRYANSSAATIPIALADAVEAGKIRRGDLLLLTAVGAGMVSAGVVLRW